MFKSIGLLSACTTRSLGESLASNTDGRIKFVSLNNQPCQARSRLVNINSNELLYYPFTVSVNYVVKVLMLYVIHMLEYVFQTK